MPTAPRADSLPPLQRGGADLRSTSGPLGLSAAYLDERDEALVLEVLRSGRLASGPMSDRFERALAERVGAPYAAAVSSGTAALHLAVKLAQVSPGDEVITTPFSFIATANVILFEGGVPVFVDVEERTLNIDLDAVEAAVTPRTKAIVPVAVFGYPLDYERLHAVAARHGLRIAEDSAEALGATYRGRQVGSFGHPAIFAFYPNKQMTTGEGGAVVVGTEEEWATVKSLASQGLREDGPALVYEQLGYNYRMSELSAALGVAQLEKLDRLLAMRRRVAARYDELLGDMEGITTLCGDDVERSRSWFVYAVFIDPEVDRKAVIEHLAAEGIASRPYFPAIHLQPFYRERFGFGPGMFPIAEKAAAEGLALPFHAQLSAGDQERIATVLSAALAAS